MVVESVQEAIGLPVLMQLLLYLVIIHISQWTGIYNFLLFCDFLHLKPKAFLHHNQIFDGIIDLKLRNTINMRRI